MVKKTINRKLSVLTSVLAVATACLTIGAIEIKALWAKEPASHPGRKMDAVYCVKCHPDGKSVGVMRMKEDGANYLFNADGAFKDPKAAEFTHNYRHKGMAAPYQQAK